MFEVRQRAAMGRIGRLTTRHGAVTTPTLLPVINPNLNQRTASQMRQRFGAQMVITNAYIIRKHEGLRTRALEEGVHALLDWDGPVMTDSGTFQSYVYGDVDVTPRQTLEFQRDIGVDVGTVLDVFTVPETGRDQAARELDETMARVEEAGTLKQDMLLAATVQGGVHTDLREEAGRRVGASAADVAPIGGVVPLMEQARYSTLAEVILAAKRGLPAGRPVHLFGAGHPLVFPLAVALGCDLFDSASYVKYAKDGRMIFAWGTRSLEDLEELPCACTACSGYADARELARAPKEERMMALVDHNLAVSFAEIRRVRQAVHDGALWDLVEERAAQNPALAEAVRAVLSAGHSGQLEASEPLSGTRAFQYRSPASLGRPQVRRLHQRILATWRPRHGTCVLIEEPGKPYSQVLAKRLGEFGHVDPVVQTPLGPVPLEFDSVWPVAQSVFPSTRTPADREVVAEYESAFFRLFEGCDVVPDEPAQEPPDPDVDAWDRRRVAAVARWQFGPEAGDALVSGRVTFRRSPNNGRVRNVVCDGEHVASVRAGDGLLSLTAPGGRRIRAATEAPGLRLVLEEDAVPFVAEGKNPMARFVLEADHGLRPGDECLLVGPDDALVGVGRMLLAGWEVGSMVRGPAARFRAKAA